MNKLNQFLAGLGIVMLAVLSNAILKTISSDLDHLGFALIIGFEWGYICDLQNKNNKEK